MFFFSFGVTLPPPRFPRNTSVDTLSHPASYFSFIRAAISPLPMFFLCHDSILPLPPPRFPLGTALGHAPHPCIGPGAISAQIPRTHKPITPTPPHTHIPHPDLLPPTPTAPRCSLTSVLSRPFLFVLSASIPCNLRSYIADSWTAPATSRQRGSECCLPVYLWVQEMQMEAPTWACLGGVGRRRVSIRYGYGLRVMAWRSPPLDGHSGWASRLHVASDYKRVPGDVHHRGDNWNSSTSSNCHPGRHDCGWPASLPTRASFSRRAMTSQ